MMTSKHWLGCATNHCDYPLRNFFAPYVWVGHHWDEMEQLLRLGNHLTAFVKKIEGASCSVAHAPRAVEWLWSAAAFQVNQREALTLEHLSEEVYVWWNMQALPESFSKVDP